MEKEESATRPQRTQEHGSFWLEGRELELDDAWCTANAAFERWWGAQIEVVEMDNVFEVSNNEQHAHNLSGCARIMGNLQRR